jgi:hypothetical protein
MGLDMDTVICDIMSMQDRTSKKREDLNELAVKIVEQATRPKNPAAVELGKLGGLKGGPARAKKLSPERRREIARKAAQTRWGKPRP